MPAFRTLAAPARAEIPRIRGSRFVGHAAPAATPEAAAAVVEALRAEFPDATHHCYAWRIDRDRYRAADDGEPSGTGGAPILRRIDGLDLRRVVVVVVRWFGGTKLGTGPLARAYADAAAAALAAAEVVERRESRPLRITCGYEQHGAVRGVLAAHGLVPADEEFGARVQVAVDVPVEELDAVAAALRERLAGRGRVEAG